MIRTVDAIIGVLAFTIVMAGVFISVAPIV